MSNNYKTESFPSMSGIEEMLFHFVKKIKQQFTNPEQHKSVNYLFDKRENNTKKIKELLLNCGATENQDKKYSGLYVFSEIVHEERLFLYTGISRNLIQRIKQHVMAGDRYTATWAFAMLKNDKDNKLHAVLNKKNKEPIDKFGFTSKENLNKEICEEISTIQKEKISKCDITFITENDNFLLHIAEVFVSCELRSYWNSFETH
ncbi:MAG: hypothetical protein A2W93_09945 [Bacteroidetes bacterium GWF2_43_63]|nr:MAG: hypothetical protein A2W93_09945 [Bacteroidetes bacterium GWF2_43_63]HBG70050.1 hypothetical protein [Bacteroidales bacterium]